MRQFCLLAGIFLLAFQPLHKAAAQTSPNLGLQRDPNQPAEPLRPPQPIPNDHGDDKDQQTQQLRVDQPLQLQSYDDAVQAFANGISQARHGIKNEYNLPFILTQGHKTARSVVLVHGLTDSPYYVRTLAQTFFNQGYNVIGLLLPGHGTRPEDLLHVRLWQWQQEVEFGLGVAEQLGDEISLVGFSTGGALVIDAFGRNFATRAQPRRIGALYLFSPALQIANADAWEACVPGATFLHPWAPDTTTGQYPDPATEVENNPYRYNMMATNSVCQLYKLTVLNSLFENQTFTLISNQHTGIFAVESQADDTVNPEAVNAFMAKAAALGVPNVYISYPKPQPGEHPIAHADVTRPETNPNYGELDARLNAFLKQRQASIPASPLRRAAIETPDDGSLQLLRSIAQGEKIQ